MSAIMVRHGGQVQPVQSDMRLSFNMATMAKGGLSRAAREETQLLIKKPRAEVRQEKHRAVLFPGLEKVKAVIEQTADNGSRKSYRQLPSMPKWPSKESGDTLQEQRHMCTATRTGATSARKPTCATS